MKDLTEGNIYKNFILFAIPLVFAAIFSQAFNLIDSIIAGKFLGDLGLGATGATSAFISFCSAFFWGYSAGFAIYLATLFGAKDYVAIKTAIYHSSLFLMFISIIFGIIVILFSDGILEILKVDEEIKKDAKIYLCIYVGGFFLVLLTNSFVHILNAMGSSSYPFFMSLLSAIINVFGNIFTVTYLKWGVAGIAVSTLFSALVADVFYVFKIISCFKEFGVLKYKVKWDFKIITRIFKYALPTASQQMIMYTASLLVQPVVNAIGSAASASYTVIMRIYEINSNVYQNSSKTVSSYTAQSIGAQKIANLKKGVRVGFIQGLVFLLVPLLICVIFAKPVCLLFFPKGYEGVSLTYSVYFVRFFLPIIVFNVINNLFHSFYRGCASMRLLVVLTLIGALSRVVFTYVFAYYYGMYGVFIGWALSWICEAVIAFATYFAGVWEKDVYKYEKVL